MRRGLNAIYFGAALLGASFIVAIGVLISIQVLGREFGMQVKGTDDLTAWSVVAAGFLPLAYTFRNGRHIRVTLLIEQAGAVRKIAECSVLVVALFFVGFLTYSAFDMVWDSIRFKDVSQGLLVIPIWIPQIPIPIGSMVLCLAIIDDLITVLRGGTPSYVLASEQDDLTNTHAE